MDLAGIATKRHSRSFDFDGEPVRIEFYPHKITPEYRVKLANLAGKTETGDEAVTPEEKEQDAQMIADLVPDWDVVLKGEPYPPTYENLLVVPCTLLGRAASEIMEVIKELSNPTAKKSKR